MATSSPAFQPEDLDVIDAAFEQTWAVICLAEPGRDKSNDEQLKAAIRKKLLSIVAAGVVDIELMRKVALSAMRPLLLPDAATYDGSPCD